MCFSPQELLLNFCLGLTETVDHFKWGVLEPVAKWITFTSGRWLQVVPRHWFQQWCWQTLPPKHHTHRPEGYPVLFNLNSRLRRQNAFLSLAPSCLSARFDCVPNLSDLICSSLPSLERFGDLLFLNMKGNALIWLAPWITFTICWFHTKPGYFKKKCHKKVQACVWKRVPFGSS